MSEAKESAMRIVQEQPDDCSLEDIVREQAFAVMIERGLAGSDAGRVISAPAKTLVVDLVQGMPEDSSYDEILKELLMNRMVERGLADVEAGRVISHEEVEKTVESWRS